MTATVKPRKRAAKKSNDFKSSYDPGTKPWVCWQTSTVESISDLWDNYNAGRLLGDGQVYRNQLVEHYLPVVKHAAYRIFERMPANVEFDDLVSEGVFGLFESIEDFDSKKNVKFETYASIRVKGKILDYLRSLDWAPRLSRQRTNLRTKSEKILQSRLGREPTSDEFQAELNMTKKEFSNFDKDSHLPQMYRLDQPQNPDASKFGEKEIPLSEAVVDDACPVETLVERKDLINYLMRPLSTLERSLIQCYYYSGFTMKETGKKINVHESRVSQVNTKLLKQFKDRRIK